MGSSYETCRGNATQDKRSGRRTAWATSDDFGRINRTGHLSGGAPPKTGWADGGAHGRILTMARGRRQGWLGAPAAHTNGRLTARSSFGSDQFIRLGDITPSMTHVDDLQRIIDDAVVDQVRKRDDRKDPNAGHIS